MTDQQKMAAYQMRLQQQLQGNMQMQAQMQAQNMGRGMMPKQQMPGMPNGQMPQGGMRPQQRPMPNVNPEQFMKNLTAFMSNKGLPLEQNPMIGDRNVNLMVLFQAVQGKGGYKPVTAANGWPHIAQAIGLPAQIPTVAPTLKSIYERNLQTFEDVWHASQKQRLQQAGNAANQGTPQKPMQQGQQMNQGQMPPGQQPHMHPQTPVKPGQPPVNGFATPQAQQANATPGHQSRNSIPRAMDPSAANEFSMPSPATSKPGSISMPQPGVPQQPGMNASSMAEQRMPRMAQKTDDYTPCARELVTYGGVDLHAASMLGAELERWKPDVPPIHDMGHIDIAALTRSLQSGIHGEVRLALDTLAAVSSSPSQMHFLQLKYCDDLVDALVDCAEEQLDSLAEATAEVSDEIQLTSYEDAVRACRLEQLSVRDIPVFGSTDYNLDRAADRLICVSTILRNMSFPGEQIENHMVLADEFVIKFLCTVIRYLGTRTMLLRTQANTLDFMKDVVVLLSNISGSIEIPGREQALCLVQFLAAFAPTPAPTMSEDNVSFAPYDPSLHAYLPHAVDALAKLLARDEPNRTHYKAVFAIDAAGAVPHELLTRVFGLAISPIPSKLKEWSRPPNYPSLIEVRKPFLMQGLLSAEILASLAPGPESGLVKAWFASDNGLGQNLLRLIRELSQIYEHPHMLNRGGARPSGRKDPELVYIVTLAASLLRRLAEKARHYTDRGAPSPVDLALSPQILMEAMSMQSPEWTKDGVLQQMTAIFNLGS